jgi:AcrR family transcriptional regulator
MSVAPPDATIRRQVLAHANSLLREDPHVPVERIARESGVSRATLYRHFGSRRALLEAVELDPPRSARERILAAAADRLAAGGLARLNLDDVALTAGVSRATVYRLFPSKPALFAALLRTYSPFEALVAIIDEMEQRPPEEVLPRIARTVVQIGETRIELLRAVVTDVSGASADALEGVRDVIPPAIARFASYLEAQMRAGRIRRMPPLLAVQAVIGPIVFHLLTRRPAERILGFDVPMDEAADLLVQATLAGLRP